MNKKKMSLLEMFFIFTKIALFTFGGGYTIVPVIKDEFSTKSNLINEEEMIDIVSIATSGPGPMAINASILTGYRLHGFIGGVVAAIASALPSLVIITILSFFYESFSKNYFINAALKGMGGVIAATLMITSYRMAKQSLQTNKVLGVCIMILSFIASYIFNINTGLIILVVAIFGLFVYSIIDTEKEKKNDIN